MELAFQYYIILGASSLSFYPYTGVEGTCDFFGSKVVAMFSFYANSTPNDPYQLKAALDKEPVSVAIQANKLAFQMYKSGDFTSTKCCTSLDHGVTTVGYGTDEAIGAEYFLVKNFW